MVGNEHVRSVAVDVLQPRHTRRDEQQVEERTRPERLYGVQPPTVTPMLKNDSRDSREHRNQREQRQCYQILIQVVKVFQGSKLFSKHIIISTSLMITPRRYCSIV